MTLSRASLEADGSVGTSAIISTTTPSPVSPGSHHKLTEKKKKRAVRNTNCLRCRESHKSCPRDGSPCSRCTRLRVTCTYPLRQVEAGVNQKRIRRGRCQKKRQVDNSASTVCSPISAHQSEVPDDLRAASQEVHQHDPWKTPFSAFGSRPSLPQTSDLKDLPPPPPLDRDDESNIAYLDGNTTGHDGRQTRDTTNDHPWALNQSPAPSDEEQTFMGSSLSDSASWRNTQSVLGSVWFHLARAAELRSALSSQKPPEDTDSGDTSDNDPRAGGALSTGMEKLYLLDDTIGGEVEEAFIMRS